MLSVCTRGCRCLFGTTVLTTNEESFFLKNVHKANLNTDGSLNLGFCTLHSSGDSASFFRLFILYLTRGVGLVMCWAQ